MSDTLDLDAYLARIGYVGPREPTLATVRAVHWGHVSHIPFENWDVLAGRGVRLDLGSIEDKLVRRRRGGYCFEHNTLLYAALDALGFAVTRFAGRVVWLRPPDAPPPALNHMLLRVDLDGQPFLADVGFGGLSPPAPLLLVPDAAQPTSHETYRLTRDGTVWTLEAALAGSWTPLYRFTEAAQTAVDYEPLNWFVATHPSSIFTTNLMVALAGPGGRSGMMNNALTLRDVTGAGETRALADLSEMVAALDAHFGIGLADDDRLDALEHALRRWAGHGGA